MENTNNSSTYDEMTENKTENQTEGFLYSSEQAETEKPVQQAVSLDKNTEAEAVQNSETSTDPNPNVTLETNAAPELNASMQMNPVENPNLNPNPGVNPNMNSSYNPNLNANMNYGYNPNLNPNPNLNQNINGGFNANMNPNLNQNINGGYNANMNMNPNMNGGYNPNMNVNPNMYQGVPNYNQPKKEVADYTSKFDEKDRSENKIYAMLAYLLGIVGIIIALLAAKKSDYVQFHVRQSIKLTVCSALLGIIMIPFAVLSLIPFVGIVFGIVVTLIAIAQLGIYILRIVAFAQVCSGKAKEPAIVGELKMFN